MTNSSISTIVFGGPSISQDLRSRYSEFHFRGPAQQGDIYQAAEFGRSERLVILDGYYKSVPAVWHKEIIFALNKGISVVGAASLGALRAVELEMYGMQGYGRIFSWYRDGFLTRDPDVAVAHTGEHDDYRTLTIPIVNILASLKDNSKIIDDSTIEHTLAIARSIYFEQRTLSALLSKIQVSDLQYAAKELILDILANSYIDQKHIDSAATLEWLTQVKPSSPPHHREPLNKTIYWDALVVNDSYTSPESTGLLATKQALLAFQLLHKPHDFMRMRERAITMELCLWLASLYGIKADSEAVNRIKEQLLENLGLDASQFESWLHSKSISVVELSDFLNAIAIEREVRERVRYRSPYCSFNRLHYDLLALSSKADDIFSSFQEFQLRLSEESLSVIDEISETNDSFPVETHRVIEDYRTEMFLRKSPETITFITTIPTSYIMAFAKLYGRFICIINTMLAKLFISRNGH